MFGMWDVWHEGCSGCGMFAAMWHVDLQNAQSFLIKLVLLFLFNTLYTLNFFVEYDMT